MLTRRRFLAASGAFAAALAAGGCTSSAPAAGSHTLWIAIADTAQEMSGGSRLRRGAQLYLDSAPALPRGWKADTFDVAPDQLTTIGGLMGFARYVEQGACVLLVNTDELPASGAREAALYANFALLAGTVGDFGDLAFRRHSVYLLAPTAAQFAWPLGAWAAKELGHRAVLCASDDSWGRSAAAAFRDGFARQQGAIAAEAYTAAETAGLDPLLADLGPLRADVVFAAYRGEAATRFVARYAEHGFARQARLVGLGSAASGVPAAGIVEGLVTAAAWSPTVDTPESANFVRSFRGRYGTEPSALALQGYDAARGLCEALTALGGDLGPRPHLEVGSAATHDGGRLGRAFGEQRSISPRGQPRFDAATHGIVQDIYIVDWKERGGAPVPVVVDRVPRVRPTEADG